MAPDRDAQVAGVLDAVAAPVFALTLDGTIVGWNAEMARLTGLATERVVGTEIAAWFPTWAQTEAPRIARALAGTPSRSSRFPFAARAPRHEVRYVPVRHAGQITGVVATLQSCERSDELEAFAYAVSHDLRAPLRHLEGFSEALLEDHAAQLDDTGLDYLGRVRRSARRMSSLIDELLELSRIGRADLAVAPCDLAEIARDVVRRLVERDPDRRIEVVIADALPSRGDARMLRALVEHLVGNAWKFTGPVADARISIDASGDPVTPAFVVRDNGVGFALARAARLFAPFQRFHRDDEFPGAGMGLAKARQIVHRHGGRIWAEASPGLGASFFFTLAAPEDPA